MHETAGNQEISDSTGNHWQSRTLKRPVSDPSNKDSTPPQNAPSWPTNDYVICINSYAGVAQTATDVVSVAMNMWNYPPSQASLPGYSSVIILMVCAMLALS